MGSQASARRLQVRLLAVFEALKQHAHPNANTLATALEVSPRTIKRDIELLRTHHDIGIDYNPVDHRYSLTNPSQAFPGARFTESELLALFVARQALAAHQGSALEQILNDGFRRLVRRLDEEQTYTLGDLAGLLSFRIPAPEDLGAELFRSLTQSLRARLEVTFQYQGLSDSAPLPRRVRPYHMGYLDQKWYLIAWDNHRRGMRTFALSRMHHVTVTDKTFKRPTHFNLAEYLRGSFGIHSGKPGAETQVEIRFDAWATRLIRERRWHASQEIRADGTGCILSLRLSGLEEIRRWILSWGEHATVLQPIELRNDLHHTAWEILKHHSPEDPAFRPNPSNRPPDGPPA
jgi:predicted DNA-binding transcriptional regulator YafY